MTETRPHAPATPARPGAAAASPRSAVLDAFVRGEPRIAADARFARHLRADGTVAWDSVLAEPGWSRGQRVLIQLAAALCGHGPLPAGAFGAHLTGSQIELVLAMCQAARVTPSAR